MNDRQVRRDGALDHDRRGGQPALGLPRPAALWRHALVHPPDDLRSYIPAYPHRILGIIWRGPVLWPEPNHRAGAAWLLSATVVLEEEAEPLWSGLVAVLLSQFQVGAHNFHVKTGYDALVQRSTARRNRFRLLGLLVLLGLIGGLSGKATLAAGAPSAQTDGALLPTYRIVAYYGNPLAPTLGRLGETPPDEMLARLHRTVEFYTQADPSRPVKPALELITPLAQGSPGDDGLYRARMSVDLIEQVAGWAADNNLLFILDVQVGRSSVADEVAQLAPYLSRPHTHLALDPEFAMGPGQVPGQAIGSLDASDVNQAIQALGNMVNTHQLPPKVLIVHRFLPSMLTNAGAIQSDPRVQVVIDVDGFGSPDTKISKYNTFVRDAGADFGGIKLFYNFDTPLLAPEDLLTLDPAPDVVIYQ